MPWAIIYDDDSCVTSDECSWSDAPCEGVLVVVDVDGERLSIHAGADWYHLIDGAVCPRDDVGALLRWINRWGQSRSEIKFGTMTSPSRQSRAVERAKREALRWPR